MDRENTYNNLDEVLSHIPDNYKIMEESIDLEIQKVYFELASKLRLDPKTDQPDMLIQQLLQPDNTSENTKILLMKLAMIDAVEAFRAIEAYNKKPNQEIKGWALLALQQSRMVIQSSLMGEQQVFISTGLGGKDNKLRYYLIFPYNEVSKLTTIQAEALKSELIFFLERYKGAVEEIEFQNHFATAMVLLPVKVNIPELIKEILFECNQLGNYLSDDALITNMKKFTHNEIIEILEKI